jgi:carbamate kinase
LESITVEEAKSFIAQGQFPAGSMLPKIEAACSFVEGTTNKSAVIGSLELALEALAGKSGTTIRP